MRRSRAKKVASPPVLKAGTADLVRSLHQSLARLNAVYPHLPVPGTDRKVCVLPRCFAQR
jgi:hypothetical protein